MKHVKGTILFFLAALLITACQDDESTVSPSVPSPEEGLLVSDRIIVVDSLPDDLLLTQITADELTFVLTDTAEQIALGTFLVSGSTRLAEYGYMRQVVGKTVTDESVTLRTRIPTLGEVFASYPVDFADSVTLVPTDVPNARTNSNGSFTLEVSREVDGRKIAASVTIRPSLEMRWVKDENGSTTLLRFVARTEVEDITLKGSATIAAKEAKFTKRMFLFNLPPTRFAIPAGPIVVPVVMKNRLVFDLQAQSSIAATVSAGLSIKGATIYAGAEYANGSWGQVRGVESPEVTIARPAVQSEMSYNLVPQITLQSLPYGLESFTFGGSGKIDNSLTLTTSSVKVSSQVVVSASISAQLFNVAGGINYTYDFNPFYKNEWAYGELPLFGDPLSPGQGPFGAVRDVPEGYWSYEEIKTLYNMGVISGYPDNTFRPGQQVTRAEFATLLVKALDPQSATYNRTFNDVQGHWAYDNIMRAARAGYIAGYADGTFRPNATINKVELLIMLVNALGIPDLPSIDARAVVSAYYDSEDVPEWAVPVVARATINELVMNFPTRNEIRPRAPITRDEAAAMLYQALVWKGNTILDQRTSPYVVQVKPRGNAWYVAN